MGRSTTGKPLELTKEQSTDLPNSHGILGYLVSLMKKLVAKA
jgi:hypothetical protein